MDTISRPPNQIDLHEYVWLGIPRSVGFWISWSITFFLFQKEYLFDNASLIGLGVGAFSWAVIHILLRSAGIRVVESNYWRFCGCGCLGNLITFELFQYAAAVYLLYNVLGFNWELGGASICFILNWFIIGIKDSYKSNVL